MRITTAIIIALACTACTPGAMQKQQSAGQLGCLPEQVQIIGEVDVQVDLMSGASYANWVASCGGVEFVCSSTSAGAYAPPTVACAAKAVDLTSPVAPSPPSE